MYFCTCQGECISVFLSIYLNNFVCICTVLFLKSFRIRRSLFLITALHWVWKGYLLWAPSKGTPSWLHFCDIWRHFCQIYYSFQMQSLYDDVKKLPSVGTSNYISNLNLKVVLNINFNLFIVVKYTLMRIKSQKCKTYSISFLIGECVNDDQLVTNLGNAIWWSHPAPSQLL